MNSLNSILAEGKVESVEIQTLSETELCNIELVAERTFKDSRGEEVKEVSVLPIQCYGTLAEMCKTKTLKGKNIRVVGRLAQKKWRDTQGKAHSKVFVVAEHIEFRGV
jgi:single-strand DNA-binding protein